VLRRPPFGHKAKSAHDMGREFRILNQLNSGFPYCPKAYVHCTDESLIGGEFYVMERVKGIILRSDIPAELNLDPAAPKPCAKLHRPPGRAAPGGLQRLRPGRPGQAEGYVQRQIEGWPAAMKKP
jgi:aminoglycoside phosphotransferase (APT) family kinase protein